MTERSQTAPQATRGARRAAAMRWLPALVALVAAGVYVAGEPSVSVSGGLGLPLDDGWIHLQLARNLARGDGLSYNPGVWVSGSTAPLWTGLLALMSLLPGSVLLWAKVLGGAFHALAAMATARLARAFGMPAGVALLAGLLTALSGWLLWAAPSAMEVPLATALSVLGLAWHVEERCDEQAVHRSGVPGQAPPRSLALLALAVLARPEAALLLVLAVCDRLVVWRPAGAGALRPAISRSTAWLEGTLLAALVIAPVLVFDRAVGGSWLPSTYAVKAADHIQWLPSLRYLRVVADILFRSQPILLLATLAGGLRLLGRLGSDQDRGLAPALWFFALPLVYGCLSPPAGPFAVGNFGRYYFPLLPVLIVLALVGLVPLVGRLPHLMLGRRRLAWAPLFAGLLLALAVVDAAAGRGRYLRSVANVEASDVSAARWLMGRLAPEALVATQDIGAIGYLLPNPVLDLAGIISPEVSAVLHDTGGGSAYWEQRLLALLARKRPKVLVVFPSSYPQLSRTAGFSQLASFTVAGNTTMAGNRLVVFATPWSGPALKPVAPNREQQPLRPAAQGG